MDNKAAMDALIDIEGFRNLNQEIETIINKSDAVKKARKEDNDRELSAKEKKELTEQEKEYKNLRRQIQEKLIEICHAGADLHVSDGLSGAVFERHHHSIGAGAVQKSNGACHQGF